MITTPRPYPVYKDSPRLGQPLLGPTEKWLAAMLLKSLQTAWDLVSQTRLWRGYLDAQGRRSRTSNISDAEISDRFVTQSGGVDKAVKKFE